MIGGNVRARVLLLDSRYEQKRIDGKFEGRRVVEFCFLWLRILRFVIFALRGNNVRRPSE